MSAHPSLVVADNVPSDSIAAFGEIFHTLKEAQILVANWRRLYNGQRPHTQLGGHLLAPETIVWPGFSPKDRAPPALKRETAFAL